MQVGLLPWLPEEKKDINGKTGEIRIKSRVQLGVLHPGHFLCFDKHSRECRKSVLGGCLEKDTWEYSELPLQSFCKI